MSLGSEIRGQIKSVKGTQKITRAMEMVAASKMRKTQNQMHASRPYTDRIKEVIAHLADANVEYQHPFLTKRKIKRVGVIVVSTDRGLCGGLNTNLFKQTLQHLELLDKTGIAFDVCAMGKKAEAFFKSCGGNIITSVDKVGRDNIDVGGIVESVKVMLDLYDAGVLDEIYLAYNKFINTMRQEPQVESIVPILDTTPKKKQHSWDYIYEPSPAVLLDILLQRYVSSVVYQAVVENIACEQAARMVAMKSASDNAASLIEDLQLVYNKARQALITQELSEIVAGAAAV